MNPPDSSAALRLAGAIDRFTGVVGRAAAWLSLIMVLIGAGNAVARYLGRFIGINLSSNAYLEVQWYLFSAIFLLGAAWALRDDAHVRVDVLYGRLPARRQALINILGTVFLLIPFSAFVLWVSYPVVRNSWLVREVSPDPGGLVRYPIKAVIIVCFALLLIQSASELIREFHRWRHGGPHEDHHEAEGV